LILFVSWFNGIKRKQGNSMTLLTGGWTPYFECFLFYHQLLMPPKPNGTSLYLAKQDPNTSPQFGFDSHLKASLGMEEGVGEFWNVPSAVFTYAVGRYPGEKVKEDIE
jgi:hypothetical protein